MQLSRGIIEGAQKIVIYGPEGIGKSYFASKFPNPVFIDTEDSTKLMDVTRTPKPTSWTMLIEQVKWFKANSNVCETLIIDTVDWAEQLCMVDICSKAGKGGIEDFGYGKGYTYLMEEFGKLLNLLSELIELGINIVLVAHATMRKFEQPDEMGAYDRWEMKLQKKVFPLVKEWADMVLFANYKTYVIDADGQGTSKGTNKAQGGKRVIFTTHHPCWDAKNRHDLQAEIPLDFDQIRTLIPVKGVSGPARTEQPQQPAPVQTEQPKQAPAHPPVEKPAELNPAIPKALADLMRENNVTEREIQEAVASKGYYPIDTPIQNYDPKFIMGVLVGAWSQVFNMIKDIRFDNEIPF